MVVSFAAESHVDLSVTDPVPFMNVKGVQDILKTSDSYNGHNVLLTG